MRRYFLLNLTQSEKKLILSHIIKVYKDLRFRVESTKDLHSRYSITVLRSQQGLFHHGVSNVRIEGSRRQCGEMLGIQSTLMWVHKKRCGCLGEGESRTHFRYRSLSSHRFSSKTLQQHLFILSVQRKTQITHVNFLRFTKNWNS